MLACLLSFLSLLPQPWLPLVSLLFPGHRVILHPVSIPLRASWLQGEGAILPIQGQPLDYLLDWRLWIRKEGLKCKTQGFSGCQLVSFYR